MKKYTGKRTDIGCVVLIERERSRNSLLPPRTDLRNHSPTGFEWGYAGSGPAQLALAICADVLRDDARAQRVYQRFKGRVIQHLERNSWEITEHEALEQIKSIEAERMVPS